jgi:GT2 family glycosyltransferase
MSEFRFPALRRPDVSIVIVTYRAAEVLPHTLQSLLDNTPPRYELIAVDNGSEDGTASLLGQVENAKVVLNSRNIGFGTANNQGAGHARGNYVVFLNQDAFVHPGWFPPLFKRIEADGGVGAVGPMLLNPDSSLQCAGALLARSGSVACYGEGEDPEQREYQRPRVVDFLAGACLLVRRRAFVEVGGFDAAYGLGYFEDADLCLTLAARGYRCVYVPASRVTHLRGRPSEELLELALRNRGLFERRWRRLLALRPLSPMSASRRRTLAARDAPALIAAGLQRRDPLLDDLAEHTMDVVTAQVPAWIAYPP